MPRGTQDLIDHLWALATPRSTPSGVTAGEHASKRLLEALGYTVRRAERRLGELLRDTTVKGGKRHKLHDESYERVPTVPAGITWTRSDCWQAEARERWRPAD